ncbi:MAG: glycosyltransferase family 39 protein, partial [Thermoanaerobaculia bacterium]
SEPLRRLLPILFGISTVGLLAWLSCRWFGRRVAMTIALIAALSPLHVRYSQELRAYSLGLLVILLAIAASERALEQRTWRGWIVLGLALALCYWSLYITAVVLVPIALVTLQTAAARSRWRRDLGGFAFALLLSAVLFSPWFRIMGRAAAKVHERQATDWDLALLGRRLQFLTVGGVEGSPPSLGAFFFAVLLVAGVVMAVRSSYGRAMVVAACAGTVGVEGVLRVADHWSNGRYNLASWPFLVVVAGLGCVAVSNLLTWFWCRLVGPDGKQDRLSVKVIASLPLVALLVVEVAGLADYFRRGRPDWQSVAAAVSAMAVPDRPILVTNEGTRISLGYYLAQIEGSRRATVSTRPRVVEAQAEPWDLLAPGCSVLVDSWYPRSQAVNRLLRETPTRFRFPRSGAQAGVIAAAGGAGEPADPWSCLSQQAAAGIGERPLPRLLRRHTSHVLELTAGDQPQLLYGWSYAERTPAGRTFRWAVGRWAAVDLQARPAGTLRLELWSLPEDQTLSVYHRGQLLASYPVSTARQTLEVPLPSDFGSAATETITFGFSRYASPRENPRPLAVAFDRVEIQP